MADIGVVSTRQNDLYEGEGMRENVEVGRVSRVIKRKTYFVEMRNFSRDSEEQ